MKLFDLRKLINDPALDPDLEVQLAEWSDGHDRDAFFTASAKMELVHRDSQGFFYPANERGLLANFPIFVIRKDTNRG